MLRIFCFLALLFLLSCKTTTYYIVRHAEKEGQNMLSDPPLTAKGEKQAQDLKTYLQGKKIKAVYSTNYARTLATAEPTRKFFNADVKIYDPRKSDELVKELKQIRDGDVLVVGHSNTVDDVVNGLLSENKMSDLADTEYGDVFIVTRKGSKYSLERTKLPYAANKE